MNRLTTHTVHLWHHRLTALTITVIYLAMLCLPVAAHALNPTGKKARECSGDCNICGCSPESRAAGTCCCAKKRNQQGHLHHDDDGDLPDCCKKIHDEPKETVIACGCPCGTDRHDAVSLQNTSEAIPSRIFTGFTAAPTITVYPNPTRYYISRFSEPPDPPPQQNYSL